MSVFDQATEVQTKAAQAYARIDSDPRLSDSAKRADKIRVWAQAGRELSALNAQDLAAKAQRTNQLQRELFGLPATATAMDALSHRDAMERAASFDVTDRKALDQATSAMRAAVVSGDTQLVKAIVGQAVTNGWTTLVDAYAQTQPEAGAQLQELQDLQTRRPQADFHRSLAFVNPVPSGMPAHTTPQALEQAALALEAESAA